MTLGSLFDGIGSWMLVAERLGIKPLWSSEIEAFPMKVSNAHFPYVKQLGDIRHINGKEIETVDIITFSSPCQNLSVAGNRVGLHGKESSLFHEAIRIIREMREATNGEYPKFIVWENVKNAFGTNKGNDFRTVLEEISETNIPIPRSGRWANAGLVRSKNCDISWRLTDARGWGVPQRRKRIFLVADFRPNNGGGQGRFAEVLFKSKSVSWNTSESERKSDTSVDGTNGYIKNTIYDMTHANEALRYVGEDCIQTLNARMGTGGNQIPVIHTYNSSSRSGILRKLSLSECEKLQGLPVGYTAHGGSSARYKAIGNGIAIPCATYVLGGIKEALSGGDCLKT
jgi:DNA (cytosine-5)-methyltransferase 1|uniref:Cytosine-specific methyltransferase n=1 Tax=Myoviridae sp. ctqfO1 TaxID=2827710 RepID=A0A8S5T2F3_9CAUD|nr:MAG TPA: Cytosine specific methyltransferase [Myoviridae sp. ctqfO1]